VLGLIKLGTGNDASMVLSTFLSLKYILKNPLCTLRTDKYLCIWSLLPYRVVLTLAVTLARIV
jgi:hypothetical protein